MELAARLARYLDTPPRIAPSAFIAPGADIVGDVTIGEEASVWYGAVLRGDIQSIVIGPRSNIQDGTVIHLDNDFGTSVGAYVTCGHQAMLHACTIADEVLVGMAATILDGARIGPRCVIGANALVTKNSVIPEGSLVLGAPAKVVRTLGLEEQRSIKSWAEKYVAVSREYLRRGLGRAFR